MKKRRAIKSSEEILKIKKACLLGDKIYSQILKELRVGVTEREIKLKIMQTIRKNGAKLSFRPIVAFGKNAYEPHHVANNTKLRKGHGFVKLDLGTKVNGYCSDMTRTVLIGRATERQRKIYQTVLEAQEKAINFVKVDRKTFDADKIARDSILKKGFPSYPHTLGHSIGKKVHDGFRLGPKSRFLFKNGMVFTIEPGIYIKGFGGVRIEDTFYLNKGKLIQLTKSPKNLIEL